MFRKKLDQLAIQWLERGLFSLPKEALTEEQQNGLMAMLWNNTAFRNYIADRNAKLVYSIAGVAGQELEPRDKARQWSGQRVEVLLLASKAKACAGKRDKDRELKKQENERAAG